MWRTLIMAWLGVVACGFVTEPVKMDREEWLDLMGDPSMAKVHSKIKPRLKAALGELVEAVERQPLAAGGLVSRYPIGDFAVGEVDDGEKKEAVIATNNAIVVRNTNSPEYTRGVTNSSSVECCITATNTRLESKMELVTDAKVSMRMWPLCHDLPLAGCQKYIDQVVRVHLNFSGTIPILAALNISESRVELFDGKQGVVFNFTVSLSTEAKWEGAGVMAETATCEITVAGARVRFCDSIEGIFHRLSVNSFKNWAITQVATGKMLRAFMEHISAAVGYTVTVPVNVISPSVFVS